MGSVFKDITWQECVQVSSQYFLHTPNRQGKITFPRAYSYGVGDVTVGANCPTLPTVKDRELLGSLLRQPQASGDK